MCGMRSASTAERVPKSQVIQHDDAQMEAQQRLGMRSGKDYTLQEFNKANAAEPTVLHSSEDIDRGLPQ